MLKYENEFVTYNGECQQSYSTQFIKLYKDAIELFWSLVPKTKSFNTNKNIGYFLFDNGVLDCSTHTMLPFDSKYCFTRKIHRNYVPEDILVETKELVKTKIFDTAYTKGDGDYEKLECLLEKMSRGLICGSIDKESIVLLGETNSGKGTMTQFYEEAFEEYVETFDTSNLIQGKNANLESTRKWTFMYTLHDARLMIGNEISMENKESTNQYGRKIKSDLPINTDMVKSLVSGGDKIPVRDLYKSDIKVACKAFMLILANDMPHTTTDKAYANRQILMHADRSSTLEDEFDETKYFKADKDIKQWAETEEVNNALVALICDYYIKYKDNPTIKKPAWVTQAVEEHVNSASSWDWVCDNYEVHDGDVLRDFDGEQREDKNDYSFDNQKVGEHYVQMSILYEFYKGAGGRESIVKFGRELTIRNGILTNVRKLNGKTQIVRVGLKIPQKSVPGITNESDDEL